MVSSEDRDSMNSVVSFLRSELSKLRTGRASAELIDNVNVEVYGSKMPIKHVATISVPDVKTIAIQPWDKSNVEPISKAIMSANLGFNPIADKNIIRISIPPLTQEVREQYVKQVKSKGEDAKVSVRQIRHKMIEALEKTEGDGVSEDDIKRGKDEIEKMVKEVMDEIDEVIENKEKELLSV